MVEVVPQLPRGLVQTEQVLLWHPPCSFCEGKQSSLVTMVLVEDEAKNRHEECERLTVQLVIVLGIVPERRFCAPYLQAFKAFNVFNVQSPRYMIPFPVSIATS